MSFGYSVGDAIFLTQIAWRTVQNSRKACGEHDELTREASSLHIVLQRLEQELRKPESMIYRNDDYLGELTVIVDGCGKVLRVLEKVLLKYNALSEQERSGRKLWQRIRFGNGELADLADIRSKLVYYTSSSSLFLNILSLGSMGRVEQQMNNAGDELKEIRLAVNGITAHLLASDREGSVLTAYTGDDRAVWREFRRELITGGFSSSLIRRHKALSSGSTG